MPPKGKAGPRPAGREELKDKKDQKTNGVDHSADQKPAPIRCAGCAATEVLHVDNEGFYFCDKQECIASCRAEIRKLNPEELEEVRAQNSAAGVPLTPDTAALDTAEQRPEDREAEGKEPKRIPPFPRGTSKVLPIKLSETEMNSFKSRLADEVSTLLDAEAEKKELTAPINEKIKVAKKEIAQLNLMLHNGVKHEAVDCQWRPNWEENTKELWRMDTGEIVDRQPLDWEDRQLELKDVTDQNEQEAAAATPTIKQPTPETDQAVQEKAGEQAAS